MGRGCRYAVVAVWSGTRAASSLPPPPKRTADGRADRVKVPGRQDDLRLRARDERGGEEGGTHFLGGFLDPKVRLGLRGRRLDVKRGAGRKRYTERLCRESWADVCACVVSS